MAAIAPALAPAALTMRRARKVSRGVLTVNPSPLLSMPSTGVCDEWQPRRAAQPPPPQALRAAGWPCLPARRTRHQWPCRTDRARWRAARRLQNLRFNAMGGFDGRLAGDGLHLRGRPRHDQPPASLTSKVSPTPRRTAPAKAPATPSGSQGTGHRRAPSLLRRSKIQDTGSEGAAIRHWPQRPACQGRWLRARRHRRPPAPYSRHSSNR
jgi:hypothetical protein